MGNGSGKSSSSFPEGSCAAAKGSLPTEIDPDGQWTAGLCSFSHGRPRMTSYDPMFVENMSRVDDDTGVERRSRVLWMTGPPLAMEESIS